jgi:hypothetical protein
MLPKLNRRRALFVLTKIDEILAWEERKEAERDTRWGGTWALSVSGAGGTILAAGGFEVFRRVSREAFPGIEEAGVLPDVDSRTPAAAGEKTPEGSGLGEGDRASQAGRAGRAALRLCNLVAQGPSDAERRIQAGGRKGVDREGNRTVGDYRLHSTRAKARSLRERSRPQPRCWEATDPDATVWK